MYDAYGIREIKSPLTDEHLSPLDPTCHRVQFNAPLTKEEYSRLGVFMQQYPDIPLRVYNYSDITDLEFLKHFSTHRAITIDCWSLTDISGFNYLSRDLRSLALGEVKSKGHSLSLVHAFSNLESLSVERRPKDLDLVGDMINLRSLYLSGLKLSDLSFLKNLRSLKKLSLALGSLMTLLNISCLPSLESLQLIMIRGLADISEISSLKALRYLRLDTLKHIDHIPDLSNLPDLRSIELINMKNVRDLGPIALCKSL